MFLSPFIAFTILTVTGCGKEIQGERDYRSNKVR